MIDLVGKRFIFVLVSLLIIIPGIIAIIAGGLKPGIDFTGGYRLIIVPKNANAVPDQFRQALVGRFPDALVDQGTALGEGNVSTPTIRINIPSIANLKGEPQEKAKSDVALALGDAGLVDVEEFQSSVDITDTTTITPTAGVTGTLTVTGTGVATTVATTSAATAAPSVAATTVVTGTPGVAATGTVTGTAVVGGTTGNPPRSEAVTYHRVKERARVDDITVGPTVGRELVGRAILAVFITSIALLIYLTLVFRKVPNAFRYGVCAVLAVLHDVLVVVGIFAILGLIFGTEIDALFITAMLTVIGFSVHDTIVVFDRVRENITARRFERFDEVVNYSLVQTLARSINTSITVILTLFALYLFGGSSIHNFVLALLLGIISGTYSSIFNASMLLVIWENREWRGRRREDTTVANVRGAASR
jgi:preprotein translocase SecF subunit